ncbi:MAG: PIN domain-containing protein [Nocardioides sp.]|uniref:PIN domain-containing protein n=1 Tax=Nocardioides sp. TaxID=35761 RepID=UPI0039E4F35F
MPLVAVYDANVLYPSTLRDVLIRVALVGLVQAKWTDQILDETFRNLQANRPDLSAERLDRTRELMNRAVRDVKVEGYEHRIDDLDLPDPDDRHVLAAAIEAGADVIVTKNLIDFPAGSLAPHDVEAQHPDAFLAQLAELNTGVMRQIVTSIAATWRPGATADDVLLSLATETPTTVSALR